MKREEEEAVETGLQNTDLRRKDCPCSEIRQEEGW